MANFLYFNNVDEYREILKGITTDIHKKGNMLVCISEAMEKHCSTEWKPDMPYVILLNQFKKKDFKDNLWVNKFRGKRMVIMDNGDKPNYWKPYSTLAKLDNVIYYKDNSYTKPPEGMNVRIGCYCPSARSVMAIKKHKIDYWEKKPIDVFFCGDPHAGRAKKIRVLKRACKKLNLNYDIDRENKYNRATYLKKMSKSKVCPSFTGKGRRSRREWEVMLVGSCLVQDIALEDYAWVIMEADIHFAIHDKPYPDEFMGFERNELSIYGYHLARNCWMRAPTIDIRMCALYLFFGCEQFWTYEDVEEKEKELLL